MSDQRCKCGHLGVQHGRVKGFCGLCSCGKFEPAELPVAAEKDKCGKCVISFIAREGSFFPCALDKGHDDECRAAGNCFKHGLYLGKPNSVPECPKWPDCVRGEKGDFSAPIAASPKTLALPELDVTEEDYDRAKTNLIGIGGVTAKAERFCRERQLAAALAEVETLTKARDAYMKQLSISTGEYITLRIENQSLKDAVRELARSIITEEENAYLDEVRALAALDLPIVKQVLADKERDEQ